ncbi:MAG: hypothetical protein HKN16_11805 [Saprospiraceae bacterium]|nr:hypothetical protein [Saprospiraceae bacterium]
MQSAPQSYEEGIVQYYEQCQIDYELVWHLNSQMCMHYGYWTPSTKTFQDSLLQMNRELISQVNISKNDHVLDAGCGVGGSSIFLAKNIGARVTGITLTPSQVEECKKMP